MIPVVSAAVVLALALDLAVAEFPGRIHPVALFGRAVAPLDRQWAAPRLVGAAIALVVPLGAAVVVAATVALAAQAGSVAAVVAAGLALFATTSLRMLRSEARSVVATSGTDVEQARERLPALVGRDPAGLSPGQVRSAAVESAAENLADGLVAPLAGFVLLSWVSPPAAAAGAAWVKAVNTLDSTLGYPDKPHGAAPARLDDLVMWAPARLSAILLAVAAADPGALMTARGSARRPASPNSGWPMATLGAVAGARLEKPGGYALDTGGSLPSVDQARRSVDVVTIAGAFAFGLAIVLAGVLAWY